MDPKYDHSQVESKTYEMWEKGGFFKPAGNPNKEPFSILLPPPNANADLHFGHAMYTVEDILIRFHRMLGNPTLWVPGADHAGFETQVVYEKHLAKEGKSRFDFDRQTLYQQIYDFVIKNRSSMQNQLRSLGFSLDWSRDILTIDTQVVSTVYDTFQKMFEDKEELVYRADYLVNYCPKCGTTFAELEIDHIERKDPLYYMNYGPFVIATVRPETKFRDTALAVNPKDKRYKKWLGKTLEIPGLLGPITMTVIGDPEVDPEFGTGIMKVTPAHDAHDFQLGKKYGLPVTPIIDLQGRMDFSWFLEKEDIPEKYRLRAEKYHGQKVMAARALMVEDLKEDGLINKIDENYTHSVSVCYKGGHDIEPTVLPNWFIKVDPLKKAPVASVKKGKVKIYPKRFEKTYFDWMQRMHDWPISRQTVWGIRIPVWYKVEENPKIKIDFLDKEKNKVTGLLKELLEKYSFAEIEVGLQRLYAPNDAKFIVSKTKPGDNYLQETDTFDTWFSSGQWPLVTLGYPDGDDFKKFYPTTVMETGYDILEFWVSRMMMFGFYLTGKEPFKNVYLHGLVRDSKGQKMSKSKGNVVNPMELVQKYGADAVRFSLITGVGAGADQNLSEPKLISSRNFTNKVWNIGRFIQITILSKEVPEFDSKTPDLTKEDKEILKSLELTTKNVTKNIEGFKFGVASEDLYQFIWHEFADKYIEASKDRIKNGDTTVLSVLLHVYSNSLKLLHPFMPFITEEIWSLIPHKETTPLIVSSWPSSK